MKKARILALLCALVICLTYLTACNSNNNGTSDTGTNDHAHSYSLSAVDTENNTAEYICGACDEKEVEAMKEYTVTYTNGETVKTKGEITLPQGLPNGSQSFVGWEYDGIVYSAGTSLTVSEDTAITAVYSNGEHVCAYSKQEGSTEPECCAVGTYSLKCSCGKEMTKIISARGHAFSEYKTGGEYMSRACFICGNIQNKAVFNAKETGTLLALGDSITFGTKLSDNVNSSYPKYLAQALGYQYINNAQAGSEAYGWYSVLTGRLAPNGNKYNEMGGLDKATFDEKIKAADIIVFSIGTNDLWYPQWRSVKEIKSALIGIIDEIHKLNPEVTVVLVGSGFAFKYNGKEVTGTLKENFAQLADELAKTLNTDEYNGFAHFVDVTRIFSTASCFEDVDWGGADYIHPGRSGHIAIADAVLDHLNVKK